MFTPPINRVTCIGFQHFVIATTGLLAYFIPDIPTEVKVQMKREKKVRKY